MTTHHTNRPTTQIRLNDETYRWFNPEKCKVYEEGFFLDLAGEKISTATHSKTKHQQLYETPRGRFILRRYSDTGDYDEYVEISVGEAMTWLAQNSAKEPEGWSDHFYSMEVL